MRALTSTITQNAKPPLALSPWQAKRTGAVLKQELQRLFNVANK